MTTEDDLKERGWVIVNQTIADSWCDRPGDEVASFSSDDDQWDTEKLTNESPTKTDLLPSRYVAFSELRTSLTNISRNTVASGNDKEDPHLGKDGSESRCSTSQPVYTGPRQRGHRVKGSRNAAPREPVHDPKSIPPKQPSVEACQTDNRDSNQALPRCMNDLLSQSNLTQLFPHFNSDQIEEWVQKCKTARDNSYIGEEVKLSIMQNYDSFQEANQTQYINNPQNASKDAELRQNQNLRDAFQPDNPV